MSVEQGYTPLPEANTERVRANLTLPYRLEESIGLNTKAVEMLCQIGGIATISIRNDNSRAMPMIVGITGSGVALGGSARAESLSKEINKDDSRSRPFSTRWSHLEIAINESATVTELESRKKDLKDPANWAKVVDNSVKDGISAAAFQNLVKNRSSYIYLLNTPAAFILGNDILRKNYFSAVAALSIWEMINKATNISLYGIEKPGEGSRLSLSVFEFPELDRMIALTLIMPFPKVAKKIK